jgi:glucose-1-phosphate adenylyltransferase
LNTGQEGGIFLPSVRTFWSRLTAAECEHLNPHNGGFRQVYVLTQFNSESLHRHITGSCKFDSFTDSFIEILAAQQTPEDARWYQGTADAVRQNLRYFLERRYENYLVLSGDQL